MDYMEEHIESGIKVGDMVRVFRKAESYENGWKNTWENRMDSFVGKIFMISNDHKSFGFSLEYGVIRNSFPYFVLEKVEDIKVEIINSSCPQCNGELIEKYSEYVGSNIKKCKSCGWC